MTTLTIAPLEASPPVCQCSPSPMQRNQGNRSTDRQDRKDRPDRQSRQRQQLLILKRSTFQRFRQYQGNSRPCSLSNPRNNFSDTRFRSSSGSRNRPRFGNFNRPFECYYCHCLGYTANKCFRWQNRNFPQRQPNQSSVTQ